MVFAGMNLLAIVIAAVAAFVFGAFYYGILSKPWMKAARVSEPKMRPQLFIVSFVFELLMAYVLAGAIGHLGGPETVTVRNGVISGAIIFAGFVLPVIAINQRYEGFGWKLTLIDAGHWLGVLVIMGAVIGAFRV